MFEHLLLLAGLTSEECRKPQPPLLLKKVLQYTSNLYCNTPPICIAILSVPLSSQEREVLQYSSYLHRSTPPICARNTPPICIAIRLPFVSQYFWENLGGCGQRDVPHNLQYVEATNQPITKLAHRLIWQSSPELARLMALFPPQY